MLTIEINNDQASLAVDEERLRQAVENVLRAGGIAAAEVSLAIVDDPTIHRLNVEFLQHDYPTDVLSFLLERRAIELEGEIIASADTAMRNAAAVRLVGGRRAVALRHSRRAASGRPRRLDRRAASRHAGGRSRASGPVRAGAA